MRDSGEAWMEMEESGLEEEWNGCGRKARAEVKGKKVEQERRRQKLNER